MISRHTACSFILGASLLALGLCPAPARAASLSIRVSVPRDPVSVKALPQGDVIHVPGAGWESLQDPGQPEIPYRLVRVLLPQGETVESFAVASAEPRLVRTYVRPVLAGPIEADDGGAVTTPSLLAGVAGSSFPRERAVLLGSGIRHGYTVATFAVFPLEIRDSALYAFDELELSIQTRASTIAPAVRQRFREGFRAHERARVAAEVLNPEMLNAYTFSETVVAKAPGGFNVSVFPSLEGSAVDYVIITPDAFAATMQALADWKTLKGVPTVVRTTEWIAANYRNGSDLAETIRNFVIQAYAKWGTTYVLLAGDVEQVPARLAWSAYYDDGRLFPVDMYYGCLDGDWNADHDAVFGEFGTDDADLIAEVYVGRLPMRTTTEASVMIDKVMDYERPDYATYANKVQVLAEVLFPSNWEPNDEISLNGADIAEFVRTQWLNDPALKVTRMYQTDSLFPGSLPETRQAALDSMATGYNHVIHVGHGFRFNMSVGDASIVNADADALANTGRLSNLNLLNCTAVAYTYECLAEHFLRNPTGGAVSVVGSNDSAFPTVAADYMYEYYRLLFNQNITHLGETFALSRESRTSFALGGDNIDRWTHFAYTLLGDPEMPLWTRSVAPLAVAKPASVGKGKTAILLTVTSGGNPVDSARVCLSKGDEDYGVGTTNASGQVTLNFRAETTGLIDVVATGLNYKRYQGTITVAGTGSYLSMHSMTIDDDNVSGTSGNGNGVIEAGETVDFAIRVRNTGTATSPGTLNIRLRCPAGGVTISDSTASISGTIPAGGNSLATGGVRVVFPSSLADEQAIRFLLIIRSNTTEVSRDDFKKEVHRPKLDLVKLRVDDTGTGNGNGIVEDGEQFKLFYKVKNFGTGTYPGGNATLTDLDAGFTLVDPTDPYPTILPHLQAENTTGFVLVEPNTSTEHRLRLSIIDTYGRAYVDTLELRAPVPPADLTVDPSLGPDRLKLTWPVSASPDVAHYNIYRSLNAGGPFALVNGDPVAHTLFINTGLSSTTKYYYKTSTLDASGNESALSALYSGSTNPAQLAGWPINMLMETTSSPAVGDIDGDGDNEIVVGDKYVYAWHANGIEMQDGDNDALTWGPINKDGDSFISHVTLAQIDQLPGLDIVAASRNTRQVFVFDHTGAALPGWPQPVENMIRAGVAVGDLEGDAIPEIVAIDELGVIYVWRPNGTELIDGDFNPATQGVFKRLTGATFHYSTPALADIDNDGRDEIIVGTQADQLYAFNKDGSSVPGFPVALGSDIAGSAAVGDVDGDGDLEIVVNTAGGTVKALHHTGATLWSRNFVNGLFFGPSPALADVDADGKLETFIPSADGKLYAIDFTGADRAGFPVTYSAATYTESSPIVADIDGDGLHDVVLGSEEKNVWAWNRSGVALDGFPLTTSDAMRGVPTAADVDQDGKRGPGGGGVGQERLYLGLYGDVESGERTVAALPRQPAQQRAARVPDASARAGSVVRLRDSR